MCACIGGGGGETFFLFCGVNTFCQLKSKACFGGLPGTFLSNVPADSMGGNQARKRKDKPNRINLISDGETSCLAKSNSLFESCPPFHFSLGLFANGIQRRDKEMCPLLVVKGGVGYSGER